MKNKEFGKIIKITGAKIVISVQQFETIKNVSIDNFALNYISVGSLVGTKLVNDRILILTIEEIIDNNGIIQLIASISGIFDYVIKNYTFGTNSYPIINEKVFTLDEEIMQYIFNSKDVKNTIGTYIYNPNVLIGYNPDILFGKHLGVFGNTGSGKTCTVVSIIQQYIRINKNKNIKYIILDVNGEYKTAFNEDECEYYEYESLRFKHTQLNNIEYGKLFRASEGIQYPALQSCIEVLSAKNTKNWSITELNGAINNWIENNKTDGFSKNQLLGYLRSMMLRIQTIINDEMLLKIIDTFDCETTLGKILKSNKKIHILDLQTSIDSLDIVLYLLFKNLYIYKCSDHDKLHINLILEEAHRYINNNIEETKLGNYYIDKLAREGRKFGIGLIISSQVPSMLSYEIVSQCNSIIMHKITNKKDMEFLKSVLRISNDAFYLQMSALEKQHAIVCGEAFPNDTAVKIHMADPLPKSKDPKIE